MLLMNRASLQMQMSVTKFPSQLVPCERMTFFPQWLFEAAVAAVVGPLQNEIRRATESVRQAGPSLQHCPTSSPSLNRGASFLPSI